MSCAAPRGGVSLNHNPSSSGNVNSSGTQPSLFRPTRAVYPALPGQPDPDDLIRDIPFPEKAVSDFQSVPFAQPPQRDVPSIIVAHISNPQTSNAEPDWILLMNHFKEKRSLDGVGNLLDLYVFMTRLVLPNAIIQNRRLLHELYMEKRNLSPNIRFRYDYWHTHAPTYTPPSAQPLDLIQSRPSRPVLRSVPTPSGQNFLQWLSLPLNTPADKQPCPNQLLHRPCHLDAYLNEDEGFVRRIRPEALLQRTAKVLSLFWWIAVQNAWLKAYEGVGWAGIEGECYA
ncbi:hypothetical protein DPSP01_011714 [Paraphaeosphaeria sporulosa]|uniref:Uncharacterized protein n=1 Tax=Paraphaeosphaeria sporulosa TaxID=1460663 RepID=A0A177CYP4_9PLEO|nr:uncharacterized protein CC84DRAFT_1254475 [Paraphaeosphaeria sporulosa]OAG12148.1 hypothetical protein CC84DRAFT_1254475 [Paraphaeosphaeria sporulosa]